MLILALCAGLVLPPAQTTFPGLAKAAKEAGDANHLEQAAVLYRKALLLRPAWAEGWFSLGTLQYDQSDYKAAALSFQQSVKLDANAGTARAMLGLCEFELNQDGPALAHLQAGLKIGIADNQQLHDVAVFHEGVLQQRSGQFEAALETLAPLCAAGVESPPLLTAVGLAALRLKTGESTPIKDIGHAECRRDRNEYSALAQQFPNLADIHYAYGRFLLHVVQDRDAAIVEFEKEIENQPASALARLQIAAADYKTDSAAGLPYAEAAVKLNPALPLGHYLLGLLLVDTGDHERAIPELETARKLLPREPGIYYALGAAYAHAGRKQEAAAARAEFQKLKNEPALVPGGAPR